MRSGSGTGTIEGMNKPQEADVICAAHVDVQGWGHTAGLTLCRLLVPVSLGGLAGWGWSWTVCSTAPEMNWEAAEVGRDFPFPSGRTGDRNFPLCSQSQTVSGFTAGVHSWSSKGQTKSSIQVSAGERRNSSIPPLQLQHCNYMLGWKTRPPLLLSREIKVKNCYVPESSALPALENILSEKSSSPPSLQSLRNGNWRTFSSHSSFSHIFWAILHSHWPHCWGTSVAGPLPGVSLTCPVTHPKSTGQIKVYL